MQSDIKGALLSPRGEIFGSVCSLGWVSLSLKPAQMQGDKGTGGLQKGFWTSHLYG